VGLADDVFGDDDAPAVASPPVAPPPPPSPRPKATPAPAAEDVASDEAIAQIDTLELARSILVRVLKRLETADATRFASLVEKALGAIARIEAIEKARPQGPSIEQQIRARLTKIDRETHELVEQYVIAAEDEAARRGVCVTCGAPLAAPLAPPPAWPEAS